MKGCPSNYLTASSYITEFNEKRSRRSEGMETAEAETEVDEKLNQ
jgi:hypothetical protein